MELILNLNSSWLYCLLLLALVCFSFFGLFRLALAALAACAFRSIATQVCMVLGALGRLFLLFVFIFSIFLKHTTSSCIFVVILGYLSSISGGLGRVLGRILKGFFEDFW